MTQYHVIAIETTEEGFGDQHFLDTAETKADAIAICKEHGFSVIEEGGLVSCYDAEDAPSIYGYQPDGLGAISVTVAPQSV